MVLSNGGFRQPILTELGILTIPLSFRLLSSEERTRTLMKRRLFAAFVILWLVVSPAIGEDESKAIDQPPKFQPVRIVPIYADAQRNGPAIAGKPLEFWVKRLLHEDRAIRELANEKISEDFRIDGIWDLDYFMTDEEIQLRNQFQKDHKSLVPLLLHVMKHSQDENGIEAAASLLAMLGPEAQVILPDLRRLAIQPELDGNKRMMVLFALLFVTPVDKAVGPAFLTYLKRLPKEVLNEPFAEQNTDLVRASVCLSIPFYTLMLVNSGRTKVEVPYLAQFAMGDYPVPLREMAIGVLGGLEFDAKAAVPSLHKLLKDDEKYIRLFAADALLSIEQDKALIPIIIEALGLKGKDREEFEESCKEFFAEKEEERKSLAEIREDDEFILPMLIAMLKQGNGFFRRQAIRNLGTIGAAAKSALPNLRIALKDSDEETRKLASEAIKKIERSVAKPSKN